MGNTANGAIYIGARHDDSHKPLLSRLTGRVFKGWSTLPPPCGYLEIRWGRVPYFLLMESGNLYPKALKRLRAIRESRGMTLKEVENLSGGRFKSSLLGSYERGFRRPTIERVIEICNFYGVGVEYLFNEESRSNSVVILDLRAFAYAARDEISISVRRLARSLIAKRGDLNGTILSLRSADITFLSLTLEMSADELVNSLELRQLIFKAKSLP
jgi:transcriptional regulator with XRE-family HTH domain